MPPAFKIAVAARSLSERHSGPAEFTAGFVDALIGLREAHRIHLYYDELNLLGSRPEARERYLPAKNRLVWDHFLLPLALRRDGVDVAIFPKGTMSLWGAGRAIAIMHDLGYFYPGLNAYKTPETVYMRQAMRFAARRAWGILTVSEFTRQDVIRILKVDPANVHTIYEACSDRYAPVSDPTILDAVRSRHGLNEPFIFYPTSFSPRKNVVRLLDAFESVSARIPHHLYFTGGLAWKAGEIERRLQGPVGERAHRLGAVPAEEMAALYSLADFTVYISLLEGFGLPVLEAFRCGTPVMISAQSCLPEIAAGAALVVDGYDSEDIARGLVRLAEEPGLRARLRREGFDRAGAFSWEGTARRALDWIETRWRGESEGRR